MDDEIIFETLDSLWFFSNIFSPSSSSSSSSSSSCQPYNSELGEDPRTNTSVDPLQASPKSESSEISEVTEQRKKKRSGEQSTKRAYKIRKEEIEEAKELLCLVSTPVKCKDYNYPNGCRVQQVSCDLDMKKQLRSWAHAVACTVR